MLHLLLKALTLLHTIPNPTFLGQKSILTNLYFQTQVLEFLRQNQHFILKRTKHIFLLKLLFGQRFDFWNGVNCASCFFDVLHQKKFSPSGCLQAWVSEKNGPHQSFREAHVLTNCKGFCYPRTNDFIPLARTSNKTETCLKELRHYFDNVSNKKLSQNRTSRTAHCGSLCGQISKDLSQKTILSFIEPQIFSTLQFKPETIVAI